MYFKRIAPAYDDRRWIGASYPPSKRTNSLIKTKGKKYRVDPLAYRKPVRRIGDNCNEMLDDLVPAQVQGFSLICDAPFNYISTIISA